jgi:hypothetical protein
MTLIPVMRTALQKVKRLHCKNAVKFLDVSSGNPFPLTDCYVSSIKIYFPMLKGFLFTPFIEKVDGKVTLPCNIKFTLKAVNLYFRVHSHALRTGFCCIYSAVCVHICVYKKIVEAHNIYHRGPGFLCTLLTGSPNLYMYNWMVRRRRCWG